MKFTLHESERIGSSPALGLAVEGWNNLFLEGHNSDGVCLQWDQSLVWASVGPIPVGLIAWTYVESQQTIWIWLSYVKPQYRRKGVFRKMYSRLQQVAIEKKAVKISGGMKFNNLPMMSAARKCGRAQESITFSEILK